MLLLRKRFFENHLVGNNIIVCYQIRMWSVARESHRITRINEIIRYKQKLQKKEQVVFHRLQMWTFDLGNESNHLKIETTLVGWLVGWLYWTIALLYVDFAINLTYSHIWQWMYTIQLFTVGFYFQLNFLFLAIWLIQTISHWVFSHILQKLGNSSCFLNLKQRTFLSFYSVSWSLQHHTCIVNIW